MDVKKYFCCCGMLLLLSVFFITTFGCNGSDEEREKTVRDEDDTLDDDDHNEDDDSTSDDDSTDDDDNDENVCTSNNKVLRTKCRIYYVADPFIIACSPMVLRSGSSLTLSQIGGNGPPALELTQIQELYPDPGTYILEYTYNDEYEGVTFEISDKGIVSYSEHLTSPGTVDVPLQNGGNGIPVEYRITNVGENDIIDLKLYSGASDFWWSEEDLEAHLIAETAALTDEEKITYLFDFLIANSYNSPPPIFNDPSNDCLPTFFLWSGGFCRSQADLFAWLAYLAGVPESAFYFPILSNHVVAGAAYGGVQRHLFDPYHSSFWRRSDNGEIADISYLVNHPEDVLGQADQYGHSWGGTDVSELYGFIQSFAGAYESFDTSTFFSCNPPQGGWNLVQGERLRIRPFADGQVVQICTPGDEEECTPPDVMAEMLFERPLDPLTGTHQWSSPTPLNGMTIHLDVIQAGTLNGELNINGQPVTLAYNLLAGQEILNLSDAFDHQEFGEVIYNCQLDVYPSSTVEISSSMAVVYSQMSPKALPVVNKDNRSFTVDWNGVSEADIDVKYQDIVDLNPDVYVELSDPKEVPGDGRGRYLVRVVPFIPPYIDMLNTKLSVGHRVEIRADEPGVTILEPADIPRTEPGYLETAPGNVIAPQRFLTFMDGALSFVIMGEHQGSVTFEVLIDDVPVEFYTGDGTVSASSFVLDFL